MKQKKEEVALLTQFEIREAIKHGEFIAEYYQEIVQESLNKYRDKVSVEDAIDFAWRHYLADRARKNRVAKKAFVKKLMKVLK